MSVDKTLVLNIECQNSYLSNNCRLYIQADKNIRTFRRRLNSFRCFHMAFRNSSRLKRYTLVLVNKRDNDKIYMLPIEHFFPLCPGAQLQLKSLTRSVQFPLWRHGVDAHSSISRCTNVHQRSIGMVNILVSIPTYFTVSSIVAWLT